MQSEDLKPLLSFSREVYKLIISSRDTFQFVEENSQSSHVKTQSTATSPMGSTSSYGPDIIINTHQGEVFFLAYSIQCILQSVYSIYYI